MAKTPEDKVLEAVSRGEDRILKTIQEDLRNHIADIDDLDIFDSLASSVDWDVDSEVSRLSERIDIEIESSFIC